MLGFGVFSPSRHRDVRVDRTGTEAWRSRGISPVLELMWLTGSQPTGTACRCYVAWQRCFADRTPF
eukprot:2618045-Amphidinium_carterae.2